MVVSSTPNSDTAEILKNKSVEDNLTLEFRKKQEDVIIEEEVAPAVEEVEVQEVEEIQEIEEVQEIEIEEEPTVEEEVVVLEEVLEKPIEEIKEVIAPETQMPIVEEVQAEPIIVVPPVEEEPAEVAIEEPAELVEETVAEEVAQEVVEEPATVFDPVTHELGFEKNVESGLQIQYTSLKLNNFPINDSNLSPKDESIENVNFNNTTVVIGNETLYNVDIKIHNYKKFRMLELRTREFKVAISVVLTTKNTLEADDNGYFRYEIFSKVKNSRLFHIIRIFQKIFSGDLISFTINDLKAAVQSDNRLQYHKFVMFEKTLNTYIDITKRLHLNKAKNLAESQNSFYSIHLLSQLLSGNTAIDSWMNFSIANENGVKPGDFINFVRVHKMGIKGIKFDIKETVHLKEPIKANELVNGKINCYKKTVQIRLEKIERK